MDLVDAVAFAARHRIGVLVTLRRDGRAQTSNVAYAIRDGVVRVSVTDDRAKTRNLERDPRAVLHVTSADFSSYVSFDGTVELSPVAAKPGDEVCAELLAVYEQVAGEAHPDRADFDRAMVDDHRRVLRFRPASAVGALSGP